MDATNPTRRKAPATVAEVNSYREPGRYSVGDGLLLVVNASGSRSWIARVRDPSGKRRDIGLGRYPEVSLKEARDRAAEHRKVARDGLDPVAEKRKALAPEVVIPTFKDASLQVYDNVKGGFRNAKHSWQWLKTLEQYAWKSLGHLPIDQITPQMVVETMRPIWIEKPETARRTLMRIKEVLNSGVIPGYRQHDLPVDGIRKGLPKQPKGVKHHPAVPYKTAPAVVKALRAEPPSMARMVLEFIILTAARSGEARGAQWSEIDFAERTWTIPAERMKMRREHVVPLSDAATSLLKPLADARSSDLVFPSLRNRRTKKPDAGQLSDVAVSKALHAIAPDTTVHGWRSAFRDWGSEETAVASEVLEKALAHQIPNAVERAYRRGDLLEKRRQLMEAWAGYLDGRSAEIIQLKGAAA